MTLKQRTIISISANSLVLTGVVLFYIFAVNKFIAQSQTIADNRVIIETENKRAHDLSVLKKQVAVAREQQEKVNQYFLRKDQIAPFLGYLESLGTENNSLVTIGSVDITKGVKSNTLAVVFKITGTYPQVMKTIGRVEQIPYYSQVKKTALNLVPTNDSGQSVLGVDGKPIPIKTVINEPAWSADITLWVLSFIDDPANIGTPVKK